MRREHSTRRIIIGAAVVGLVVLATVGGGHSVNAESRPGNGTKESFQSSCEQYGGTFIDSPKDKLTACFWPNGGKTVCDSNGNDCINYDPPKKPASSAGPVVDESMSEATTDVGTTVIDNGTVLEEVPVVADETQIAAPVDAPLIAEAASQVSAPVDTVDTPAEGPIPAAASDEQP